jgi:hypothetical protein
MLYMEPRNSKSRLELLNEFELAPDSTLFPQQTLCAVLSCSPATAERNRWAGIGIPFFKIGRAVRYRKSDILKYLPEQKLYHSTVEMEDSSYV